jgi:hypothetical protein
MICAMFVMDLVLEIYSKTFTECKTNFKFNQLIVEQRYQ